MQKSNIQPYKTGTREIKMEKEEFTILLPREGFVQEIDQSFPGHRLKRGRPSHGSIQVVSSKGMPLLESFIQWLSPITINRLIPEPK